jgi:hypothetical protein
LQEAEAEVTLVVVAVEVMNQVFHHLAQKQKQ